MDNNKYKILTIVGARPQFIKAAAISHAIRDNYADCISEDILHTGQHYDDAMSGQFFSELDIPQPKYNLGVGSSSHGVQTAAMLNGIENIMLAEHYDGMIVYGDTNSTLAGALAAAKLGVPIFHVEAGLRSFKQSMPEEINRVLTDHVSSLLFAPTETAIKNLQNEGFKEEQIVLSGDVMLDNVLHYSKLSTIKYQLSTPYVLATVHRDFNTDNPDRLNSILSALNTIAKCHNTSILLPLHPRTRKKIKDYNFYLPPATFHLVEPLSYLETLAMLRQAKLVLTDSGGLQKEAFFCGKPCVVLRHETEWTEIVECGASLLADADEKKIVDSCTKLWNTTPVKPTQFGDGHAAKCIVEHIVRYIHTNNPSQL